MIRRYQRAVSHGVMDPNNTRSASWSPLWAGGAPIMEGGFACAETQGPVRKHRVRCVGWSIEWG